MATAAEGDPETAQARQRLDAAQRDLDEAEADLAAGLISARAFTVVERRVTPLIQQYTQTLAQVDATTSAMAAYLARGARPLADMPLDERRETIRSFIRVRCHQARRGRGFDPDSVEFIRA